MVSKFRQYSSDISHLTLPERFTFPFYYEVNPLARLAAEELQDYLETQSDFEHNFGLIDGQDGIIIGKMFGVLVVQTSDGELGYLSAFSGKLANSNHHDRFVPPVYDVLVDGDFYLEGEKVVSAMNEEIEKLEKDSSYLYTLEEIAQVKVIKERSIKEWKDLAKQRKQERAKRRSADPHNKDLEKELVSQSLFFKYTQKDLTAFWESKIEILQQYAVAHEKKLNTLKEKRSKMSNDLQQRIFDQYTFLNADGNTKSLREIFQIDLAGEPPAGSGECAAPKLLHYAYQHDLQPVALAEFWWGASPKSEVRKHGHYYPSCRGKCEPILGHMLQGLTVDPNPLLQEYASDAEIEILYEDEHLAVINKPHELLSQPGKVLRDCVQRRMKIKYPDATGPLIVHRLDMATSGLMLIAKTKEIHQVLQRQFTTRSVKKRYVALLDGIVPEDNGIIDLPLRVDLDDRPRQLVCYEHGKSARTEWHKVAVEDGKTRVHFHPITGRTHQLRVHAAHTNGLNTPIVGDDLYGTRADRLHLHAAELTFIHPVSREEMTVVREADF